FWAKTKADELKPKSLSVRFFVRMDDVSKRILGKVNDSMTEADREKAINQEIALIEKENNEGGKYTVSVKSFYEGNEYYYFVYQDYTDVRLVGTPPASIGKFGGDTDNWEWPRHTGDFALFRVYADQNGNPAEYAKTNVPLKPKHHLPISLNGFKEGDFAMILGYPGRTNRWMPSAGISQNVEYAYPAFVEASKVGMDVMKKYMDQDQAIRLKYASKYAGVANYWKNRQGMSDALTQHKTALTKAASEKAFNEWANKAENKVKYGNVIQTINEYYASTNEKARHDNYLSAGVLRSSSLVPLPYVIGNGIAYYIEQNEAKRAEVLPKLMEQINASYDNMHMPLEKEMLIELLNLYAAKAGNNQVSPSIASLSKNEDYTQIVKNAFESSIIKSKDQRLNYVNKTDAAIIAQDTLVQLANEMMNRYRMVSDEQNAKQADFAKAFRLMVQGMREANPETKYYPDANSTLRLSYGKIRALPAD